MEHFQMVSERTLSSPVDVKTAYCTVQGTGLSAVTAEWTQRQALVLIQVGKTNQKDQ